MTKSRFKTSAREKRHRRVKKKIFGTKEKPRLCVYRSLKHIYAQLIDDTDGGTILGVSTLTKDVKDRTETSMSKVEKSKIVGLALAQRAQSKNIKRVAFDRSGYRYHGRVRGVAEGAREGGLKF